MTPLKIFILSLSPPLEYYYNYHMQRFKTRAPLTLVGIFGQIFAVHRHYISYAELLKIRYSDFPCLILVGTEDRLVREANSYMLRKVRAAFQFLQNPCEWSIHVDIRMSVSQTG